MSAITFPAALVSLPPATRALTLMLVGSSTLLFILRLSVDPRDIKGMLGAATTGDNTLAFPWLVMVPGNVMWYPWTLLTSASVESNLIEFIVSLLTLPLAGRYLERVWGQAEFLKFVFVTVVASNIIAVVVNVLESYVLGNTALFLYGMPYHGLMGLQVGFLVAFTQLIPEHQVQIFGGLAKMRVKSLPMLYVTFSNVLCLLGYQSPYILIQFGWLVAWFYLRFIKYNEGGDFRGDRSDTFAFASWFPPFAQKYITRVTTLVFNLAVRFGVLRPWTDIEAGTLGGSSSSGGFTAVGGGGGTPGGARAEAERRRAMALKALDQRMATKPTPTLASSPQLGGSSTSSGSAAGASTSPRIPSGGLPTAGSDAGGAGDGDIGGGGGIELSEKLS